MSGTKRMREAEADGKQPSAKSAKQVEAEEKVRTARIIQLSALRAHHESEIASINKELNGLLQPEIDRIIY